MQPQNTVLSRSEEELFKEHGQEYPAGSVIFSEGDPGQAVYFVQRGAVQIAKSVGDRSKVLAKLTVGDFFGEMALISERPRSATATAIEECQLAVLGKEPFFKLLRNSYEITLRIVEQLAARLAEADRRLETLLFTDATTRLVRHLESLPGDEVPLEPSLLAYEMGLSLDRLQRITAKFGDKGILTPAAGGLTRVDRAKLGKLKSYLTLKEEFGQIE
jgi:CRP/FNR family cyclic AMP-dependent transcriptional regulator